ARVARPTRIAFLPAAAVGEAVPGGDAVSLATACAALSLLTGVVLAAAAVLRLGFVANFISEPVLTGFKAGIGLVIVFDQVPKLLGIHFHKGSFFHNIVQIGAHIPDTSVITVLVGGLTMAILAAMERFLPRAPAPLVAIAAAIAGVSLLGLQAHGVTTVGKVPTGLPSFVAP